MPKTGGISIGQLHFVHRCSHITTAANARHIYLEMKWDKWFQFAFVRHPLDRFVSLYHYFRQIGPGHRWWTRRNRKVAAIVRELGSFKALCLEFPEQLKKDFHFRPQHSWVCDADGNLLVDYCGRFEALNEGVAYVAGRVGAGWPVQLPHVNSSRHQPWGEYYNAETAKAVTDYYRKDFDLFGYDT